jgi:hypothetical protein
MAIQVQGNGGTTAEVDGTAFRALRVVPKPLDHGAFGHFRLATTVPLVVTQAANGTLFSFRWGDATRLCVIQKLRLAVLQTAAQTATQGLRYQAFFARSFTASDSVGTAITLTGNSMKKRTSHATSLVTDIRKSAVAAGLTAGTRTLDAEPFLEIGHVHTITNVNPAVSEKQLDTDAGDGVHPFVLAQNEGVIIRGPTTVFGAAGTADLLVEMAWAEVTAY